MKVLLISANREEINMRAWPLGLACVAESIEKAGHVVHLLDLIVERNYAAVLTDTVEDLNPDIIGISFRNIDYQHMIDTKDDSYNSERMKVRKRFSLGRRPGLSTG